MLAGDWHFRQYHSWSALISSSVRPSTRTHSTHRLASVTATSATEIASVATVPRLNRCSNKTNSQAKISRAGSVKYGSNKSLGSASHRQSHLPFRQYRMRFFGQPEIGTY